MPRTHIRIRLGALFIACMISLPAVGQITIQYDNNNTGSFVAAPGLNRSQGNIFTGLTGSNKTITSVSFFLGPLSTSTYAGAVNVHQSDTNGAVKLIGQLWGPLSSAGNLFVSVPINGGLGVTFTGTSVLVGVQQNGAALAQIVAFDGVQNTAAPAGFHGRQFQATGGNPVAGLVTVASMNAVVRIKGPTGLPAELIKFEVVETEDE